MYTSYYLLPIPVTSKADSKFCKNASLFHDNIERAYDQLSDFLHPSNGGEVKCIRPCETVRYEATLQKKNENGKLLANR